MHLLKSLLSIFLFLIAFDCSAQQDSVRTRQNTSKQTIAAVDSSKQRDLIDFFEKLLNSKSQPNDRNVAHKVSFSVVPSVSYSLTTGFQADLTANAGFYTTKKHTENYSEITGDITFDTKKQKLGVFRSEIWFADNQYKLVTDTRLERFPEDTYGLGTLSTIHKTNSLDFKYIRNYITVYKKIVS